MADMKISDLPTAQGLHTGMQLEVNDSGNRRKVTTDQMYYWLKGGYDNVYSPLGHTHSGYALTNHTHTASQISDATHTGRLLMQAADKTSGRAAIGAGTSNLELGTTSITAKPGDWKPHISADTTGNLPYSRLTGVPDQNVSLPNAYAVGSYLLAFSGVSTGSVVAGSTLDVTAISYQQISDE